MGDRQACARRLADGASLLGIEFLDHVIVASSGWASIRHGE